MSKSYLAESSNSCFFSEQTTDSSPCSKSQLKAKFIEYDRIRTINYIKDLEETVKINKNILEKVIGDSDLNTIYKSLLLNLNKENMNLLNKLKDITTERDNFHCKWLISEQMMEFFIKKDWKLMEIIKELKAKKLELMKFQQKCKMLEELLRKYEIKNTDKNVVFPQHKSNNTQSFIHQKDYSDNELENSPTSQNKAERLKLRIKPLIPRLDLSKLKTVTRDYSKESDKEEDIVKELNKKIQVLETQNKELINKVTELEKKNRSLAILNLTWSGSVKNMEMQLHKYTSQNPKKALVSTPHKESPFETTINEDEDIIFPTMLKLSSCNTNKTGLVIDKEMN